jgi:hypothetical protein
VGVALGSLLDPISGKRRRAYVRDKAGRVARRTADAARTTGRDMRNRLGGAASSARTMWRRDEHFDGAVLKERVRARLGRYVSHPGAIDVDAQGGVVTVSGPVLGHEADRLLRAVGRVRGVSRVEDQLSRHDSSAHIPALQGGAERTGPRSAFVQGRWSPTSRAMAGAACVATVAAITAMYGVRHREPEAELYVLDIIP